MENSEIIGIIASAMVLASFLMPNELMIRIINIIGAILFVIYGIEINAFSVWISNAILCIVHIAKIIKIYKRKRINTIDDIKNDKTQKPQGDF